MQKSNAKTLAGFMELEPKKQIAFNKMKSTIKKVFESYGLSPMDTPVLEYSDVLLAKAGGETEKQIYRFTKGDADLCMRFDLTVPFAKFSALHQNTLIFPFRRYQIGKVFRGERAQKGRFREFYQCDVDIISDTQLGVDADSECIAIMSEVYEELGFRIQIKISNRKIWKGVFEELKIAEEKQNNILNTLDKKDKIGKEKTLELLKEDTKFFNEIYEISEIKTLENLDKLIINNEIFCQGKAEIKNLFENLKLYELKNDYMLDLSIIRGLDYYTGAVFEAVLLDIPEKSSICGGGHYSDLAKNYTDKPLEGVGMSIGLTRLFDLLDQNNLLKFNEETTAKVAVLPLGNTKETCLKLANILRKNNIKTLVEYFEKPFKFKMNYANKIGVSYIIVVGEDEVQKNQFGLKNMATSEVFEGSIDQIIKKLEE